MEPIEILLVGGAIAAFGGAAVLATLSGAIREPAKRVIIATLKLHSGVGPPHGGSKASVPG